MASFRHRFWEGIRFTCELNPSISQGNGQAIQAPFPSRQAPLLAKRTVYVDISSRRRPELVSNVPRGDSTRVAGNGKSATRTPARLLDCKPRAHWFKKPLPGRVLTPVDFSAVPYAGASHQ